MVRPQNEGFAAGVNTGWRVARSPWLLVLNPDVEVADGFPGPGLRATRYLTKPIPTARPGIVGFGLHNPDGISPGLGRRLPDPGPDHPGAVHTALAEEIPGRLANSLGTGRLGNRRLHARQLGDDRRRSAEWTKISSSTTRKSPSAEPPGGCGWRVEYDASVSVVHRHPLQNRAISPKMRVITRHSKLLYFLKHLPRWQFLTLIEIVKIEAASQRVWSRLLLRPEDVRAWQAIGDMARRLGSGKGPRGREVLALAEQVVKPTPENGRGPSWPIAANRRKGQRAAFRSVRQGSPEKRRRLSPTLLEPRKDGSA